MNDYLLAIIHGIIQGLTEFLPVSSSGHLILLHNITNFSVKNEILFDVMLHLATILAVIWFFWNDLKIMLVAWLKSLSGKQNRESKLAWAIIISTIPAVIAGLLWGEWLESLRSPLVVVVMLIFVAILFIVVEKWGKHNHSLKHMNYKNSLAIGLAQALALIPGTSRSGITIVAGLAIGIKREAAIRYSFLMSVPIILGANAKKITEFSATGIGFEEVWLYIVAFVTAFVTAFFTIKYFIRYSRDNSLIPFAYYRFALALLVFLFLV